MMWDSKQNAAFHAVVDSTRIYLLPLIGLQSSEENIFKTVIKFKQYKLENSAIKRLE